MSTPAPIIIDFLPERYRQATSRRRSSYWRVVVAVLFVGIFVATAFSLHSMQVDVRREYEEVNLRYLAAKSEESLLTAEEAKLARITACADLLTFLRHPWPRSRLIDVLFSSLPATVRVERFTITNEPKAVQPTTKSEAAAATPSTERNATTVLAELRKAVEQNDVVIRLEGITQDQPALHGYLQSLSADGLFLNAQIESIDAVAASPNEAKFTARIIVLPGWGLAGGPSRDAPETQADETPKNDAPAEKVAARGAMP